MESFDKKSRRASNAALEAAVPEVAARDVYICASPRFSAAVRETLAQVGVPKSRIHQEDFAF
jgi:ferredoxin-NADP reductase